MGVLAASVDVLAWWNLIYLLPFGLATIYLLAYALSGWTFGDGDVHGDVDAGAHPDVDVDAHADVHVGPDLSHGHDLHAPDHGIHSHGHAIGGGGMLATLTWLGIGRVPVSILLMVLCFCFGAAGFFTNQLLRDVLTGPAVAAVSLPIAVLGGLGLTSLVANAIAKWLPMSESSARARRELVGCRAVTLFPVDGAQGVAIARGVGAGERYQVACRVAPGRPAIGPNVEVVLVRYDEEAGVFQVVPSALEDREDGDSLASAIRH